MKSQLKFEEKNMTVSLLGEEASVPDLVGSLILQNDLNFHLEEEDEIYEAYGKCKTSYPYRQHNVYNRKLVQKVMKTAVLENDFIKAVFLPELGGRLWELTDKRTGKNLLYTNDVIRYSNLATCNAWFSGGVEWNIGIIGHSPFTTEQLYTASLHDETGNPVLRMYEYERLRGVEYQMDFWLNNTDGYLNCRMRIVNSGSDTVPMYWWSNMAVPEYQKGRIVVPADKAYTTRGSDVYKVQIPVVDGVDITCYEDIPKQVDYFFDIPDESPKFIANLDENGYGLLHLSTKRLRSRKLFSWGNNQGSARWQDFLTKDAGRYVEIQGGLGKTQYGCIPMAPHTAWEWMEQYGSLQITKEEKEAEYDLLKNQIEDYVKKEVDTRRIEERLTESKKTALAKGTLIYSGKGWGSLEGKIRENLSANSNSRELSSHLEYASMSAPQKTWCALLETDRFPEPVVNDRPGSFVCGDLFFNKLQETIGGCNKDNWYAQYQFGIMCLNRGCIEAAEEALNHSLTLADNAWAHHGLAACYLIDGQKEKAAKQIAAGIKMRPDDLGYVKEGLKMLLTVQAYEAVIELYPLLPEVIAQESRILFDLMLSLTQTGNTEAAQKLLQPGFTLDDIREGEDSVSDLWKMLNPEGTEVPKEWDFYSL